VCVPVNTELYFMVQYWGYHLAEIDFLNLFHTQRTVYYVCVTQLTNLRVRIFILPLKI